MHAYSIHNLSIGIPVTQICPTAVRKTTIYESRRKLDQPMFDINPQDIINNDEQIEEQYEVTILSNYDESGFKIFSSKPMTSTDSEKYVRNFFQ
jgi:hypothetical protein